MSARTTTIPGENDAGALDADVVDVADAADVAVELALVLRAQAGDRSAAALLCERLDSAVRWEARLHARQDRDLREELEAEGRLGVLVAVGRYDAAEGARFATYAQFWVAKHVRELARRSRRVVRFSAGKRRRDLYRSLPAAEARLRAGGVEPTAEALASLLSVSASEVESLRGVGSVDSPLPLDDARDLAPPLDEQVGAMARDARVRAAVATLRPREREILRLRYEEGATLGAAAEGAGLGSWQRAQQIELVARDKLRRLLADLDD